MTISTHTELIEAIAKRQYDNDCPLKNSPFGGAAPGLQASYRDDAEDSLKWLSDQGLSLVSSEPTDKMLSASGLRKYSEPYIPHLRDAIFNTIKSGDLLRQEGE